MQLEEMEKKHLHRENNADLETIMASHLPPRSEYHKQKRMEKRKKKKRIQHPVVKLLAAIFLLLPIIIAAVLFYREIRQEPLPGGKQEETNFEQLELDYGENVETGE